MFAAATLCFNAGANSLQVFPLEITLSQYRVISDCRKSPEVLGFFLVLWYNISGDENVETK